MIFSKDSSTYSEIKFSYKLTLKLASATVSHFQIFIKLLLFCNLQKCLTWLNTNDISKSSLKEQLSHPASAHSHLIN